MAAVCTRCSRANPREALFCYFDGMPLPGKESGGPLRAGTLSFPRPFVFPNGHACHNFNQLVMACQKNWETARDFLASGIWTEFLQTLGRHDLAAAAKRAAQETDKDQALHRFLGELPCEILQPPRLAAEPTQINLGHLRAGAEMRFELRLVNQGMRLLSGTVESDVDWLSVGEGTGASSMAFRTPLESVLSVRVAGKNLRAANKPLEGRLTVATNGGTEQILVRAEVPIRPFPDGIMVGATTPREIAVRAKARPQEAADVFESGAVEAWYRDNGWDYPVQGPAGSGVGAVQQFFEALGLTRPPTVDVEPKHIHLMGVAGSPLKFLLEVKTQEKRPVFAHAVSSQPWLIVGRPRFAGSRVSIPIEIPALPDQPDQTIRALLSVRANGNQRFTIPVMVDIRPGAKSASSPPAFTTIPPPEPTTSGTTEHGGFGLRRMVYWNGLAGGWSAFAGWLLAELLLGHGVGQSVIMLMLMVIVVSGAIGGGLTLVGGLVSGQRQLDRVPVGLAGGAIAGLVGSLFGNQLFSMFGPGEAAMAVGRVLGWTFMGAAIGAWEGIHQRDRVKLRNGVLGGALGGFLGGLLFNPISSLVGSPLSSRAVGFVVLGFCVGLFIGLVQVLLKEGWLTVVEGFRPGRQLLLGQGTVTLGTSEKASLIFIASGARGVEPIHFSIARLEDGSYQLEDQRSRTGTTLNGTRVNGPTRLSDGDIIGFGVNSVRFNERLRPSSTTP